MLSCAVPRHADNLGLITRHSANFGAITRHVNRNFTRRLLQLFSGLEILIVALFASLPKGFYFRKQWYQAYVDTHSFQPLHWRQKKFTSITNLENVTNLFSPSPCLYWKKSRSHLCWRTIRLWTIINVLNNNILICYFVNNISQWRAIIWVGR